LTEFVTVGRIGRPHGLDGSVVVERPSENESLFEPGKTLYVGGEPAAVAGRKRAGGRLVVKFDRPVERGAEVAVLRAELPEPEADSYYVFQLVGLDVVEEGGRHLGRVVRVEPGVANDALALADGLLLPLVGDCVRDIDLEAQRILVAPGFSDPD
jgi:16S rRNA processing protein RimM